MQYKFPHITNLKQVEEAIKDNTAFVVAHKGLYTIVNYYYNSPEVFPEVTDERTAILRECRGIAFDGFGKIISRPFHKFFNHGEREETRLLSLPEYHEDKLDGSMIRPLYLTNGIKLATKMGITEIAEQAEEFALYHKGYYEFFIDCEKQGLTPIFEWCSKKNRVILEYPADKLVLLAIRNTVTGQYVSPQLVRKHADKFDIPVVKQYLEERTNTRELKDIEGFVFVYPDGHRVKVKSDWYVNLHRAKDAASREKDLIRLIITDKVDDLKPLLTPTDLIAVEKFEKEFIVGIAKTMANLAMLYRDLLNLSRCLECTTEAEQRKAFATRVAKIDNKFKPFMFKMLDHKDITAEIKDTILKHCSSGPRIDEVRWLFGNAKYEGFVLNA